MKTLTRDTAIAKMFSLATVYEPETCPRECIIMPKLNGIRAMFIPGRGFWTRDGMQYSPAVTDHILVESFAPIDGEFYVHGWPLQRINAAIGVNLDQPVEDTATVKFHAFDLYDTVQAAFGRFSRLAKMHVRSENVELVRWYSAAKSDVDKIFGHFVSARYEGVIIRDAYAGYCPGRTRKMMKRKAWQFTSGRIVAATEGLGKFAGMLGGFTVADNTGRKYNVGCSKGLDDARRTLMWVERDGWIGQDLPVRYISLSDAGLPLNATFVL